MKKLFIGILSVLCLITLSVSLTACAKKKTAIDNLKEQGYTITVRYDPSGGKFLDLNNSYLSDMFNPTDYTADESGKINLKLIDPTDRVARKLDNLSLTRAGYAISGWYRNRELVKDEDGNVLGEDGSKLFYDSIVDQYYFDEEFKKLAIPQYSYSQPWDFNNDVLTYDNNGKPFSMTLYAAWVSEFSFTYYAKNADGEWEEYGKTKFDYNNKATEADDYNVCYLPRWNDTFEGKECGGLTYKHKRDIGGEFSFERKADDLQFIAAYTAPECTEADKITDHVKHVGTVDKSNGKAINPDMKIYVDYEQGARYRIYTAQQLINNADADGIYEIYRDLEFTVDAVDKNNKPIKKNLKWPTVFELNVFEGSFVGMNENGSGAVTISNLLVEHTANNRAYGGMFGGIGKKAKIKNIVLKNLTFDLMSTGGSSSDHYFGLFAGIIEEGATLENITIEDAKYRINAGLLIGQTHYLNLIATNSDARITRTGDYTLEVYGMKQSNNTYRFELEYLGVDENGRISTKKIKLPSEEEGIKTYHPYTEDK